MPRSRAAEPTPPAETNGDVYTMAEAARLKGVSYHTVSRAVRRGKLPAQRLGRMALIAADDLRAWRPMRERAPRKYRRRDPNPNATPALLDLASGERVELARRLSTLFEVLHGSATELPLPEFLSLLTDRLAAALNFRRVALWGIDLEAGQATRLAAFGPPFSAYPSTLALDRAPVVRRALEAPAPYVIDDVEQLADRPPLGEVYGVKALFVAPLRVGTRTLGVVLGDCNGEPFTLSKEQLVLAQAMANQAALAMDHARLRVADTARADQLAAILENVGDAVFACDAAGRLTVVNAAGRDLLGVGEHALDADQDVRDAVALVQRRAFDGTPIPPEVVPLMRALRGERVRDQRHVVVRADGSERAVSVNAQPIVRAADGALVGAVAVARDISVERLADERDAARMAALERVAARAAAVADVALAVNAGTDLAGVLRAATAHLTELLGGAQGAIFFRESDGRMLGQVGHGFPDSVIEGLAIDPVALPTTMVAFGRRAPVFSTYAEAAPSERVYFDRFGVRSAIIAPLIVGEELIGVAYVHYQSETTRPTPYDLGFAAALANQCAVAIDKTRLMDRIDSAHQRLLAVVDQLPQGVVIVEAPAGRVVLANRAAERLWGAALPLGEGPDLAFGDADGTPFAPGDGPLSRTLRSGTGRLGETLTVLRADGTRVNVLANHAPVRDGGGRIVGAVSVLQDVAELRALDRAKDEFLSVAAHELRNPLTSLHGNLQLLLRRIRKEPGREGEAERLDAILAQSDRLAQLVGRLLDVSRAELGRLDLSLAPADAAALVGRVVAATRGLDPTRQIVAEGPKALPVVWDEVRVEQILANLVANAVRYAPSGEVRVTYGADRDGIVSVTVSDHGPGIPDAAKARLFERYYRAAGETAPGAEPKPEGDGGPGDGLGLGLYISRKIARAHGGDLTVESDADLTTFRVRLPLDGPGRNAPVMPEGLTAARPS